MVPLNKQNDRDDIFKFFVGVLLAAVPAAVGYGILRGEFNAHVADADRRHQRCEAAIEKNRATIDGALNSGILPVAADRIADNRREIAELKAEVKRLKEKRQ